MYVVMFVFALMFLQLFSYTMAKRKSEKCKLRLLKTADAYVNIHIYRDAFNMFTE